MRIGSVDVDKLRGLADKGAGLGKELIGTLVGSDRLSREGEAQQERAAEELKALRKQIEAQQKEAKAEAWEQRQRVSQTAKETR
jgi:uncharacterized protein YjbJ (UPF0337 family)